VFNALLAVFAVVTEVVFNVGACAAKLIPVPFAPTLVVKVDGFTTALVILFVIVGTVT